ncbi:hypothetical protein [Dysgonomonas termitidis]|uniref:Uncharacterized protein n=1 Tax=Dysgonomonas termitidis TaxID=1516126 RepID=A0ABV9KPI3_9BACT
MITKDLVTLVIKSEGVDKATIDLDKLAKGVKEIELEAKDAKAGIRGLKDENKELQQEIKEDERLIKQYNAELKLLREQAQGASDRAKQLSQNIQRLTQHIDNNTTQINKNNTTINTLQNTSEALNRTMKVTDMTVIQLSNRAEYLQGKLASTSQALDPAKWEKYRYQLLEVETQKQKLIVKSEAMGKYISLEGKSMDQLAAAADRLRNRLANMNKEMTPAAYAKASAMLNQVETQMIKMSMPGEKFIRTIKITDMTMNQLSASAEYLRFRLANISKSLNLAEWNRYNKQLQLVEAQQKKVAAGGDIIKTRFGQLGKAAQEAGKTIGKVFLLMMVYQVIRFFTDLINKAREWIGTSIEVASKAEGVIRAFRGLGDTKLLDKLREQTRGLINDFTLMQAAVKADKYKIPVSEVGNLLDFAARRAIDMGKEVDDFQRRIIDGIGRQSKLVLDDLGFSSVEISRAMAKEGSFAKGVIALVNKELEKQGPRALTAADMATKATVKWENAQLKVGNQFLWINKLWSQVSGKIADWVTRFAERQLPDIMNKLIDLYNHFVTAYNGSELLRISVGGVAFGFKLLYNNMKLAFDFGIGQAILLGKTIEAALSGNIVKVNEAVVEAAVRNKNAYKDYLKSVKEDFKSLTEFTKNSKLEYITPISEEEVKKTGGGTGDDEDKKELQKQKKELATRLENLENAHKDEILALKKYAFENNQTDEELKYETLKSDYKYYADRMQLIGNFLDEFKVKDEKFLADIGKMQADTRNSQFELLPQFDANKLAEAEHGRDISLQILQAWVDGEKKALEERNLGEEQRARELELIDIAETETRLAILQKYGMDVEALELQNGRIKAEAVKKANADTLKVEADAEAKRRALQRSDRDKNYDVRSGYGLTTVAEDKSREQRGLQDLLAADLIDYETYQKLLTQLNKKYEDERLAVREQYGLASVGELYNSELENLKLQHEQKLLSEEEFEEAKFRLRMEYASKYVEEQQHWNEKSSNLVSALMEAETAKLDAEYDVRIEAAKGNKEETERLENEKAQKKLDIEKKYADVQFAVKASEIIANTAVAIMTGYAQLGPIAGTVAAVMLAATGAAQLISANAERQKVKNMTLGNSNSDSNTKYERVLSTPKEEGGYFVEAETDAGKKYKALYDPDKRGFVDKPTVLVGEGPAGQSREWVASNAAYKNPTIRPIIDLIDAEQRAGTVSTVDMNRLIRARMAGLDTGGFIARSEPGQSSRGGQGASSTATVPGNRDILMEIYDFIKNNRLKAEINYQELMDTKQKMTDYESFGTKY